MVGLYPLLLLAIIVGLLLYTVIPDIFLHKLGIGSYIRQYSPGVVLTFDDGPDPVYTPRLLDILKQNNVKAVFFLLGEKAERYPNVVQRIVDEGHQLGSHSYSHRLSWFMSPLKTWEEWNKSIRVLERMSGRTIEWIRPPHGVFNLALWVWCLKHNKKAILYNSKGYDWLKARTPEQIRRAVLKQLAEGSIILLHDGGGEEGAPENTLQAIETICNRIQYDLKLPIVTLELPDWNLSKRTVFALWQRWEHFYARLFKVKRIDSTNLFRLTKRCYQGPNLYTPEGTLVAAKGDLFGEIHLDSIRLQMPKSSDLSIGLTALKRVKASMSALAQHLYENPEFSDIKVLAGVTFLNRGVQRLGFNVQDLPPTPSLKRIAQLQKMIMRVYHPSGNRRNNQRLGPIPKLVWITKEDLFKRFLPVILLFTVHPVIFH